MKKTLLINGRTYLPCEMGGEQFFQRYVLPQEATGPFCLLSYGAENYNATAHPCTTAEYVGTPMLARAYVAKGFSFVRAGGLEKSAPRSMLNPAWWAQRGFVAAEVQMND